MSGAEGHGDAGDLSDDAAAANEVSEAPIPLGDLDRALDPIRRVVRYVVQGGEVPRYLAANLSPHLGRAEALDLPEALRAPLAAMVADLDGIDGLPPAEGRARLSRIYAWLTHVDAITGLPLPLKRKKPVRKPVQRDRPEDPPPPSPPASDDPPPPPGASASAAPAVSEASPPGPEVRRPSLSLASPIEEVAPDVSAPLAEAGIHTLGDLLGRAPVGFETYTVHGAGRPLPVGPVAVGGRIAGSWTVLSPTGAQHQWSRLVGAGPIRIRWGDPGGAPPPRWRSGDGRERRVVVVGSATPEGHVLDAEVAFADGSVVHLASYGIPEVPDRAIRQGIGRWVPDATRVRDPVSRDTLKELALPSRGTALADAHRTGSPAARRRLAFDEALLVQLAGMLPRARSASARGIAQSVVHGVVGRLGQILDLVLDDAQQVCFEQIKRDLRRPAPMRRVLTGEVGGGRGKVALMAICTVAEARSQVLVLADDDAGAASRFLHDAPVLREAGIVARHVTVDAGPPQGGASAPDPAEDTASVPLETALAEALRRGEVQVVYSTVDLLARAPELRRLGLVVAIERDRWGEVTRRVDALPAPRPDLLVLPSVPVGPRLLLTAYADHDVGILVEPRRRPAQIQLCTSDERDTAYARLRNEVRSGGQAIVVFPMVRGRDALDLREALRVVRALQADALQDLQVGLFHGSMPVEERWRAFQDLAHRRLQVLVCTTRIEEGPRPPGASLVVIEQADATDAWRLHRIIGWMSRSDGADAGDLSPARLAATAVLVPGELASEASLAELRALQTAPSGAALTELRVAARGVAEAVGTESPPLPELSWLDLDADLPLVLAARDEAVRILEADPALRRGGHVELAQDLVERWGGFWPDRPADWTAPSVEGTATEGGRRRRRRRRRRGSR